MNEATSMANKTNGDQKKENAASDWRDKKSIKDCVNYLSEHKMWHDVTFSISGKHLHGHRLILSLRSPVFEAMFYGPAADKNEVIEITDIEYDIFDAILRYMYTDTCGELTGDNVLSILYAAKKYCLSELVDRCSLFLEQSVTYYNVCAFYEQAKLYDMDSLVKICFDLMIKESNAVCKSSSSVCMSYDSLLEFLSSEHLTGDELVFFEFINKWANQQCLSNGIEPSSENKRVVLADIVKKISYQFIKIEDFARVVVPTNILLPEEQIQIFQYIATRDKPCIEKFSIPPRQGFPVTIDTRSICGTPSSEESFCFQFSCNTNVRLVKLFPLMLSGISDFGMKDVKSVKVNEIVQDFMSESMFEIKPEASPLCRDISIDILDDSALITKDIGIIFEAYKTYNVRILLDTNCISDNVSQQQTAQSTGQTFYYPSSGPNKVPGFESNMGSLSVRSIGPTPYCPRCGIDLARFVTPYSGPIFSSFASIYPHAQYIGKASSYSGIVPNKPTASLQQKDQSIAHTSDHTFTNGSFSCTIKKIPRCVEVVEFIILPK